MVKSLRARLLLIVGVAALSLLVTLVGSALIAARQTSDVRDVEQRLVPKLALGPELEGEFERLRQTMQDAVAAQDAVALEATSERRNHIFDLISSARTLIDPSDAALLRWTIHDYYETAHDVSRRLIAGDTGENLVDEMARMQAQQARASELIKRTTGLNRAELASSFAAVRNANQRADSFRFAIGLTGLALVLAFSLSVSRTVIRALHGLSGGFSRFAMGQFAEPIPGGGLDELAKLAREANQMADALRRLAEERDRADWLKESQAKISDELRGDVDPAQLADRVVSYLARRTGAVAAALYLLEGEGLVRRGRYGLGEGKLVAPIEPTDRSSGDQGLLLQALRNRELLVVSDVPETYLKIRSGLGESAPRSLVFLPLSRLDETIGVLELALFKGCSTELRELLESVQEMLVIALQAARSRGALREALARTQQQAERLTVQEEELRSNNQELQSQHEELRVANSELETQRRTLSQQNAELEDARGRLQQKAEELTKVSSYKSQFLANMSHELRTPLNSMLLLSHLLAANEAGNLTPKQVEYCKTIHGAGNDLLTLINQVLDLAKIEAGRQDLQLETVPLRRFGDYARRVFEPLAAEKKLALIIDIDETLPAAITTDPQRVERIITNLLGNGIKFTERGEVALRILRPAEGTVLTREDLDLARCVAISVSDTGIGIAPEAHQRVFAPFEQIDSQSNRKYAGTGLGLAISRESVTLLGGELQLVSEPNKGSTFTCFIPFVSGEHLTAPVPRKVQPTIADDRAALQPDEPHLLVIEDDPVLAEQLVDIVRARRLKVLVASTGADGLRLARERRPQGIVLDVRLPDTDGWAVMEQLRNHPVTREIPVHFVSGVDSPDRGLALGAIGYLMKPASHAELALAVRALAPGSTGDPLRILVVEDSVVEADSLCELLSRENFDARRVGSAAEALSALEKTQFACMILDLGLPDMDGLVVLETLRERRLPDAPRVIIHTGRALNKRETQQLEAYAEAVVLKEGNSSTRLLEEIRLFVNHVTHSLSPRARSQIPPPRVNVDLSFDGAKVLVAEDDMRTVYALSALLHSKGATVLVADTGRDALQILEQNPDVACVLMDIMMPEMDGYEATRRLRRNPLFASLPVIALTAKAMTGERARCIEAGASDYLTKPIDTEQLLLMLRKWLTRGARAS